MKRILLVSLLTLASSVLAHAGAYDELSADQKNSIQNGEQVFISENVAGSDWPKASAYQRVAATPEEVAAVFNDVEKQKDYISGIKESSVVLRTSKTDINVAYEMSLGFPFGSEKYTVRNKTSVYDSGSSYRFDWSMVRADSCKEIEGKMRFEKLGTGTILAFYSFIQPGKSGASAAKGKAMSRVKEFADSVKTRVEALKASNQALLQSEIAELRAAVSR